MGARPLQGTEVGLSPTRSLLGAATRIAIDLDHPACDCRYLAVAAERNLPFVTADTRFQRKLLQGPRSAFRGRVVLLSEAATGPSREGEGRESEG